ncbi:NIPA Mg2+ uptake permease family, partial [Micromonas pusilla CCMP1545]
SSDLTFGIALAMSSSLAIGSSFIVKKKGLKLASARGGLRAGSGGFGYLREPLWWGGMITMIVGEVANFAAYAYAPAVIVTPLGALSIIVAAVLSHHILRERLNGFGWLGCFLCVVGSLSVVMHAPEDRPIRDVRQLWEMASAPTFATYAAFATCLTSYLITSVYPRVLVVPIGICSLAGSLSVMGVKALGIALRLTWAGSNQFAYAETWACVAVVAACVVTQMNYLNKALDVFNAAVVTPVYYVGFTTLTLLASSVMFKDYERQSAVEVTSQLCGFATILSGVFVLHVTKDV